VLLQPVPAWSMPAKPRNVGPQGTPPPTQPADTVPNVGARFAEDELPGPRANVSRRHETSSPEGRVYRAR
jgi:hypothetical protein